MWQTIRKPSAQERSKTVICIALAVFFVVMLIVGTIAFKVHDYYTMGFMKLRDQVVANYTTLLFENQGNISIYDFLTSIDASTRKWSQPLEISPKHDIVPVINLMLGMRQDMVDEGKNCFCLFFFAGNLVVSFIAVCLCYKFDKKFNERYEKEWSTFTCPPRDIVMEYQQSLAKEDGESGERRVCSIPGPLPTPEEINAFLTPVRYPRPAIRLLLALLIFSSVLAMTLAIARKTMFSDEFFSVLKFCAARIPYVMRGFFWDYLVWFISVFGVVLYYYTMYGLTLITIDTVFTIVGVRERFTPILLN